MLIIVFIFITICWLPPFYIGSSISGKVVDEDTGKPIEGLNVVADWELRTGFLESHIAKPIYITETVTDENGYFYIDGWGPRFNKIFHSIHEEDPMLILLKDGYEIKILRGMLYGQHVFPYVSSNLNNKTFKIKKHNFARERKSSSLLSDVRISLTSIFSEKNCHWKKITKFLKEYESIRNNVVDINRPKRWRIQSIYEIPVITGKCDLSELRRSL